MDAKEREALDIAKARQSPLWDKAVEAIRERGLDKESIDKISEMHSKDPELWWTPYHFFWGMGMRNWLRREGFGESEFGIDNLDNIYIPLVEEAAL